jgi:hypothetical protein
VKAHPECPICGAAWIDEDDKGRCIFEHEVLGPALAENVAQLRTSDHPSKEEA